MPYNYFQQKAIYDQMNGTKQREEEQERERVNAAKAAADKRDAPKPRPSDPNQLARIIVNEATDADRGSEGAPKKPKPAGRSGQKRQAKKPV